MKKLFIISLLLLALVFTVVACTDDPVDPIDTTVAETTGAIEEPTQAPTDADEETTKAEEPTETPAPEETTAPAEDPTQAPETTKKPDDEKPTEPPVTEPVTEPDPMAPVNVFDADALNNNTSSAGGIESFERIENFLRIDPSNNDPNYYPFANIAGGRFIAIKYRTPNADGTTVQLYIGSTGTGPTDDTSMLCTPTIADGEWHVALFDTQSLIDAGIYDGSTVSYFRFDALECDYIRDENGEPQKDPVAGWLRHPMPEGAYVDIEYVAFFNSVEAAELYELAPAYIITSDMIASGAVNTTTATPGDGFVTLTGTDGDGWIMVYNGEAGQLDAKVALLVYRTTDGATGEFFAGTGSGPVGGSERFVDYVADGEWHAVTADLNGLSDMSGGVAYMRYDYFTHATGLSIDVQYIAMFDTVAKAEAYYAFTTRLPEDTHNFVSDIASQSGDYKASDVIANLFVENPGSGAGSWLDVTGAAGYGVTNLSEIKVDENGAGVAYHLANYNELIAKPNGTYAYSVTILDNADPNRNFLFVRGVRGFNFGDQGYFGHDGNNNYAGCGGIYAMVKDGVLTITIRSFTDGACVRNIYTANVDSNKITLADNGKTVYILAGDALIATVDISGTRDFGYSGVAADECAAKVVLTLAGEEPVEIADAIVAATHLSDLGMAIREHNNYLTFSEVSLNGFSSVNIPELPAPEGAPLTTDKTEYTVGDPIMVTAIGSGDQWVGLYQVYGTPGADAHSIYYYYVDKDGHVSGETYRLNDSACYPNSDNHSDKLDLPAGQYRVMLFADGGYTVSESITITVVDPNAALSADKDVYLVGESITVIASTYGQYDWVGIFPDGDDQGYISYYYPNQSDKNGQPYTFNADGSLAPGKYNIYLLASNLYPANGATIKHIQVSVVSEPPAIVDTPVEGAANTIVAEGMLALPADYAPSQTNKNLFGNDKMTAVEKLQDGDVVYTHYPIPTGSGDARVLFKRKYSGFAMDPYMIIRYRTNVNVAGRIHAGYEPGDGEGAVPIQEVTWTADGQWQIMAIDLSTYPGIAFDENGKISVLNITLLSGTAAADYYFDIDYIAFYADEASWKAAAGIAPEAPSYATPEEAGVRANSFDTFYVNNSMYFPVDGGAHDKLNAIDNTITFEAGAAHDLMSLRGWIGFQTQAVDQFGYAINGGEAVWGDYKQATEEGVLAAGGEFATRFQINANLSDLTAGTHSVAYLCKLADGTQVILRTAITVVIA